MTLTQIKLRKVLIGKSFIVNPNYLRRQNRSDDREIYTFKETMDIERLKIRWCNDNGGVIWYVSDIVENLHDGTWKIIHDEDKNNE